MGHIQAASGIAEEDDDDGLDDAARRYEDKAVQPKRRRSDARVSSSSGQPCGAIPSGVGSAADDRSAMDELAAEDTAGSPSATAARPPDPPFVLQRLPAV